MIRSDCLCQKKSVFDSSLIFRNEKVFKKFDGIIIGQCKQCHLLKTVTQPKGRFNSETTHADFYEDNRQLFNHLFQPIIRKIQDQKKTGSVLDVGCSSGIMLELLAGAGYDFFGIEPNEKAFRFSQKKFKNRVFHGYLADFIKRKTKKFDVVIYNHVLEHVADIKKEIRLIKKILKPGGLLVIGLPNTRNVIFFLRKKYWEYLVPLEHIWHFSDQYLIGYLGANGFENFEITYSNDKRLNYPPAKRIYFSALSFINQFFGTGELMLIIATKK